MAWKPSPEHRAAFGLPRTSHNCASQSPSDRPVMLHQRLPPTSPPVGPCVTPSEPSRRREKGWDTRRDETGFGSGGSGIVGNKLRIKNETRAGTGPNRTNGPVSAADLKVQRRCPSAQHSAIVIIAQSESMTSPQSRGNPAKRLADKRRSAGTPSLKRSPSAVSRESSERLCLCLSLSPSLF